MDTLPIVSGVLDALALSFFLGVLHSLVLGKAARAGKRAPGSALLMVICAFFCTIAGNPDRIKSFKLSATGLQADAQDVIQKAQISIEQMQNLAAPLATATLNQLAFTGSIFGDIPAKDKFSMHDQILASLSSLSLPSSTIDKAQSVWKSVFLSDIQSRIVAIVQHSALPITLLQNFQKLGSQPSPDKLRAWIVSNSLEKPEINLLLDAYNQVWSTGTLHNPDLLAGEAPALVSLDNLPKSPDGLQPRTAWNNGGTLAFVGSN